MFILLEQGVRGQIKQMKQIQQLVTRNHGTADNFQGKFQTYVIYPEHELSCWQFHTGNNLSTEFTKVLPTATAGILFC
jgi:hypothetical protein